MFDALMWLVLAIVFVALPISIILLIIRAIKKKPIKKNLKLIGALVVAALVVFIVAMFAPDDTPTEESQSTTQEAAISTTAEATTEEITTTEPTTEEATTARFGSAMVECFKSFGFTHEEAEEMEKIFKTVGLTDISNVRYAIGDGIDKLQAFTCDIFDYSKAKDGLSVHFTVDKRQLCFISLDGIPATNVDYAYINIFGNVKFKTSSGKRSVTLYDVWDENGEIIPNAVGYKAVFDYENKKITAY